MAHSGKSDDKKLQAQQRQERLAAELRSNLLKRKAQTRGRAQRGPLEGETGQAMPDAGEAPATPKGETA
ncbi:MAG TPA: hypothetical protein VFY92_02845 [Hyphomicrobiaceae bacterium]|nr:hypothetical protein [Hyphomicrobiaceae bacterium]